MVSGRREESCILSKVRGARRSMSADWCLPTGARHSSHLIRSTSRSTPDNLFPPSYNPSTRPTEPRDSHDFHINDHRKKNSKNGEEKTKRDNYQVFCVVNINKKYLNNILTRPEVRTVKVRDCQHLDHVSDGGERPATVTGDTLHVLVVQCSDGYLPRVGRS